MFFGFKLLTIKHTRDILFEVSHFEVTGTRTSAEKFPGRGARKKQDRKIAPLSLPLLYQYHVGYENPEDHGPLLPTPIK